MSPVYSVELMKTYTSVMTEEQYDRIENAILAGVDVSDFTTREVEELASRLAERKNAEELLFSTANRNNQGIQLEHNGNIEDAIKIYEVNIQQGYPATHSFERLMKIYRRLKRYKDEIKVIDRAIEVFSKENERRFDIAIQNVDNEEYLLDIQAGRETCTDVRNNQGWVIYRPYPLINFIVRREQATRLLEGTSKNKHGFN